MKTKDALVSAARTTWTALLSDGMTRDGGGRVRIRACSQSAAWERAVDWARAGDYAPGKHRVRVTLLRGAETVLWDDVAIAGGAA